MDETTPIKFPVWTIALDVLGTLLLAAGLFGLFAGDDIVASLPVDLRAVSIALIIVGALLMAPLIVVLLQRAISPRS